MILPLPPVILEKDVNDAVVSLNDADLVLPLPPLEPTTTPGDFAPSPSATPVIGKYISCRFHVVFECAFWQLLTDVCPFLSVTFLHQ